MRFGRHSTDSEEPLLFLEGDQPTIYRRRRIRWKGVLKWASLALVAVILILVVVGYMWLRVREFQMRVPGLDDALDPARKGQPVNTLILGVDRGSVKGEGDPGRADIVMLMSVDAAGEKAALISIPRDTRLIIPGHRGYSKINASYAAGGPRLAIETVRSFTGLEVNHYVIMDFEGFKHIVNAVGGVPMHIEVPINDPYAGDVPSGDVVLNGDQALTLVRARHDTRAVPAGDLDRVKNQRRFLKAMLSAVSHQRNPFRMIGIINAASANIETDLTFGEMISLGRRLQRAEGDRLQTVTAPGKPAMIGGVWYYMVDEPAFQKLLADFKPGAGAVSSTEEGEGGEAGRSEIRVSVLNGTRVNGLASSVSGELKEKGYTVVSVGNARTFYGRTTIYYGGGDGPKAETAAEDLPGVRGPALKRDDDIASRYRSDVVVVLGSDYGRGRG